MSTVIRIDDQLAATLRKLSKAEHRPIGHVIEDAVAHYQREKFWREVEASVERLRADPVSWKDYKAEIVLLEGGSMDGLADEDPYYSTEEVDEIRGRRARTEGR